MVALVSDEDLDWITVLKTPRHFVGSLMHPTPLDRLIYGFLGPDTCTLAAVHIPASAFEVSAAYNVLDEAAAIHLGLEGLPVDQVYHPYIDVGTPNMTNSTCRCLVLLPIEWHVQLSEDHPYGITLKAFYDIFILPYKPSQASLTPMCRPGGGMPPHMPLWPGPKLAQASKSPLLRPSHRPCAHTMMAGPRSKSSTSLNRCKPGHPHSLVQHLRQACCCSGWTWPCSTQPARPKSWPSMQTERHRKTDVMCPRLLRADLELPSSKRCCGSSGRTAQMTFPSLFFRISVKTRKSWMMPL